MKNTKSIYALILIALLISACAGATPADHVVETSAVSTEAPAAPNETLFAALDQDIVRSHPYILAVQISDDGRNVFERHYDGQSEATPRLTASVTKSFLSTLVGIAWDKGYISDLDAKIIDFFPEYRSDAMDARVNDITIRHLLNMTSGVEYDVTTDIMRWIGEADAMQYLFVTPPKLTFKRTGTKVSAILSPDMLCLCLPRSNFQ